MSVQPNLTDQDYELLSAYIDGVLDDDERAALESRLQTDANLRKELAALRQTIKLVKNLPALKAPRNFTLTPVMVEDVKVASARPVTAPRMIRFPTYNLLSTAASVVMIALGILLLFGGDEDMTAPGASTQDEGILMRSLGDEDTPAEIALTPTMTLSGNGIGSGGMMPTGPAPPVPMDEAEEPPRSFGESMPEMPDEGDSVGMMAMTAPGAALDADDSATLRMAPEAVTGMTIEAEDGAAADADPFAYFPPPPTATPMLMATPEKTIVAELSTDMAAGEEAVEEAVDAQEAAVEALVEALEANAVEIAAEAPVDDEAEQITEEPQPSSSPPLLGLVLVGAGGLLLVVTSIRYVTMRKQQHG